MKRMDRFDRPLVWKDGEVFSSCVDRCNNETNVEILRRTAMVPTFFEYSVNVWYIQWAYVWLHVKWRNLKISVWDFFFLYSTFFYIFPFRVSMYIKRKIDERSMHRVSVSFEFVATLFSGIWYTISRNVVKPFISIDCFIVTLHATSLTSSFSLFEERSPQGGFV